MEAGQMKDLNKVFPAYRDPVTGRIFTGNSHAGIGDAIIGDASLDRETKRRVIRAIEAKDDTTGFLDEGEFISREEAQKRYGFTQSHELWGLRAKKVNPCRKCLTWPCKDLDVCKT
jgi:hypothetical protein